MSPDPEKPIERLLRRYARKRRERAGEPWTVHPVTRRLWQQEVARRFPKKRTFALALRDFFHSGWLKPGIALAGAAAVIVVGLILAVGPHGRTDKVTTASSGSVKLVMKDKAASQLATANGTDDSKQFFVVADNSASLSRDRAEREALPSPSLAENGLGREKMEAAPGAPPASTLAESKKALVVSAPQEASAPSILQGSVAPAATAAAAGVSTSLAVSAQNEPKGGQSPESAGKTKQDNFASFARAESGLAWSVKTGTENVMQYGLFTASQTPLAASTDHLEPLRRGVQMRSFPARPQSGYAQRVLTSFNVEQAGRELRVIDSDGSVYAGPVQSTNTPAGAVSQDGRGLNNQAVSKKGLQSRFAAQESEAPPLGSSFQLTGTNKTLNRRVVFAGVLTTNQALVAGRVLAQNAGALGGAVNNLQTNQGVQDLHLSGTAVIEGEPPVRIEASPASK
jgi:hypothetical protein